MDNHICSVSLPQTVVAPGTDLEAPDVPCSAAMFHDPLTILFLTGYGSRPGGVTSTLLRVHGHTVIEPDLPDNNFAQSVAIAQRVFHRHQPDVVIGWSRGGAVAMSIDSRCAPLILVAPAWKSWGTMTTVKSQVTILHSPQDELVSIEDSRILLQNSGLLESRLLPVGEDHRMIDEAAITALVDVIELASNNREKRQAA